MRKLILAAILLATPIPAHAATILFDFESIARGEYSTLTVSSDGLSMTLSRTSGNLFEIWNEQDRPASWGNRTLDNFTYGYPVGDAYNANFNQNVNAFLVQFGDFGPSDDDSAVTLQAFSGLNGTGSLVAFASTTWVSSDGFPNVATLSVSSATPFLSVRFAGAGQDYPNSLFWDNMTVTSMPDSLSGNISVPEPASLVLLATGLGAVSASLRRRRRIGT